MSMLIECVIVLNIVLANVLGDDAIMIISSSNVQTDAK